MNTESSGVWTLERVLDHRQLPYTQDEALELIGPVLLEVEQLHQSGCFHGRIRTATLLLTESGLLQLAPFQPNRKELLTQEELQGDIRSCCQVLYALSGRERLTSALRDVLERALDGGYPSAGKLMEALYPQYTASPPPKTRPVSPPVPPVSPEPAGPAKQKRGLPKLLAAAAIILVGLSIYFQATVEVPYVTGTQIDGYARAALERAGLVVIEEADFFDTASAGTVVSQSHTGRVLRGTEVTLVSSLGPGVDVPELYGRPLIDVLPLLEESMTISVEFEEDDSYPPGTILAQSVEAGTQTAQGTNITLTVSTWELEGVSLEELEDFEAQSGFMVEREYSYSDSVEQDHVISALHLFGDRPAVQVRISMGSEYVSVPDFRGMDPSEAQELAQSYGLTLERVDDEIFFSPYARGTIGYQRTEPQTSVKRGTTVYYDTSRGILSGTGYRLTANRTSFTLTPGGSSASITLDTQAIGGVVVNGPEDIDVEFGTWYEKEPFNVYFSATDNATPRSGMMQAYVYTGKESNNTAKPVAYVNLYYTISE